MASQLYQRTARMALRSTGQMATQTILRSRLPEMGKTLSPQIQFVAPISTSKKDKDTIAAEITSTAKKTEAVVEKKRPWVSLGYEWDTEDNDRNSANLVFFSSVTIGVVCMGFLLAYWPDHQLRNWSQREAHIELARREALGLPLVDPNLVPPESVYLPSEEELGDFDIII